LSQQETATRLVCAAGLAEMENKKYKNAARLFSKASMEHCKCPDVCGTHTHTIKHTRKTGTILTA